MQNHSRNQMFDSDEPLALIVEGVFRSLWFAVIASFSMVRLVFRAPLLMVAAASSLGAIWFFGWRWSAFTLAGFLAGVVIWRFTHRASYMSLLQPTLSQTWRAPLYRLWFPHVARRCGLVVHEPSLPSRERRDLEAARLLKVRVQGTGAERLLLRLPVGMTPEDVAVRAQAVGQAFGVAETRTLASRPGRVWLEFRRRDVLKMTVRPVAQDVPDLAALTLGLRDDGRPWHLRLQGTHVLIAGATGAGKGSVLWSMVAGLAKAIEGRWVEVWALDPKGGMELGLGRAAFSRFEGGSAEAMCDLLEELVELKTRRSMALSTHGIRTHVPHAESPHIVMVIDELATLTAFAERSVVRRVEQALGVLLTQGRAVGISVVAAVQDPGKDVVTWRDLFPARVAMRLDNPIQVDMVLGDGARERGALADQISELQAGVAYVRVEGTREISRVRAAYLSDEDVRSLADGIEASRTAQPQPEEAA
ncbi:cell division protein FtsK [Knoellia sinensis KCTC 19936]|uniref:Cell division protein FtsK n=1 Tax=Knoellia sinensis KCTC 19936 TaxID=1385520 RepID=A0A0A0J4X9_9MICO|nr:FtsK/SpoIIIE domain-containing protein [Knoellia sinensis]KGN31137.1 cell division protein FtsK [Knoellia sinensis KCTC 19936]